MKTIKLNHAAHEVIVTNETVEVQVPYYYMEDLTNSTIVGRIDQDRHTAIEIADGRYSLRVDSQVSDSLSCYLNDKYKATRADFRQALVQMKANLEMAEGKEYNKDGAND